MKTEGIYILVCVFGVLVMAPMVRANWVQVNLAPDYWNYKQTYPEYEGYLENANIDGKGACVATSMINSFWYLQNKFPTIYTTGHKLIPDDNLADARDSLHRLIWFGGYSVKDTWEEKLNWFERFEAPGVFKGVYQGSIDGWSKGDGLVGNTWPTWDWLWMELSRGENVEIFVRWSTGHGHMLNGHLVTLTSLHFNDTNGNEHWDSGEERKIDYLDNNTPWKFTTKDLWENMDGSLGFQGLEGVTGDGVWINGAFSESIPEPATIMLLGLGGLALVRRRIGGKCSIL